MPKPDLVLWVDLETTGTNRELSKILEVAAVLTDATTGFEEIGRYEAVIKPRDLDLLMLPNSVYEMHRDNGLLNDVRKSTKALSQVQTAFFEWLANKRAAWMRDKETLVPPVIALGGSGVGHFDRDFLERDFKSIMRYLVYWNLDIGVVRRFRLIAGIEPKYPGLKTHRAMDDILGHIDEARAIMVEFNRAAVVEVIYRAFNPDESQ
jgi:oligoribonuclease (3'-5' exoribonuclease)